MTTATGTREVRFPRHHVWRALTTPTPYCPVCDVSYVFAGAGESPPAAMGQGTTFVCVPGRLEGTEPPSTAPRGTVTRFEPERCVSTRLELTSETWLTEIELTDCDTGATLVTCSITRDAMSGSRLRSRIQRNATRQWIQHVVQTELAKVIDHVGQFTQSPGAASSAVEEADGLVLHLRGDVRPPIMPRAELEAALSRGAFLAVDVSEMTYLDAAGLRVLARWARETAAAGRDPVIRGESQAFDAVSHDLGAAALFVRRL